MPRLPRSPLLRDLLLGLGLTVIAEVELVLLDPARIEGNVAGLHLVNLLLVPAVGIRRVSPFGSMTIASLAFAVQPLMGQAPIATPYLALLFLLGSLGWHASTRTGALGVALTLLAGLTFDLTSEDFRWADLVVNAVIIIAAWATLHVLRRVTDRRIAAEVAADRAAREAVALERERISRDLHDSVAHALTLMTLQSGGARERTDQPLVQAALGNIERTGREALADLHRFLHLLGPADSEAPGLAHLPELVESVRRSGLDIDLDVAVEPALLPSVATTVYRVVQEGLTNVLRHSDAARVRVEVRREATAVIARVINDGRARTSELPSGGHGLAGLRQRLGLFDGSVEARPTGDGWLLEARIPLERA